MFDNYIAGSYLEQRTGLFAGAAASPSADESTKAQVVTAVAGGKLERTKHFRLRARQRKVSYQNVMEALRCGSVSGGAQWDEAHGSWKYRIIHDRRGARLVVVFGIDKTRSSLRLITVWRNTQKVKRGAKARRPLIIIVHFSTSRSLLRLFVPTDYCRLAKL